jgi:predicted nucleic acid-binding Zn ribbon protein
VTTRRPDRRSDEPRPLRDSLAEVSADLGLPEPDALALLIQEWESLVGPDVAPHCRLTSLRDGVLRVTVDTAPRGTQLRYLEGELVERAGALVGDDVVRELRVRVGSPSVRRER